MAAQSAISAVVARYGAIASSFGSYELWFDGIPQTGPAGTQQSPPYVNLVDEGTTPEYDLEHNPIEVTRFRFEVFASTLVQVDSIMWGIKYGASGVTDGAGFDFCGMSVTGQQLMECRRTNEVRHRAPQPDPRGLPMHQGTLSYELQAKVN